MHKGDTAFRCKCGGAAGVTNSRQVLPNERHRTRKCTICKRSFHTFETTREAFVDKSKSAERLHKRLLAVVDDVRAALTNQGGGSDGR